MSVCKFTFRKPGLLVSVRNAAEALAALAGGADIIDVKEPERGPLGRADLATISAVVRAVNDRAPVTAAMGELVDLAGAQNSDGPQSVVTGISLFKIGLAGCAQLADWQQRWQRASESLVSLALNRDSRPVAVAYADWCAAQAPNSRDVLRAAIELRCPVLLIDTWNKSAGSLFGNWPIEELRNFLVEARSQNLAIVLAGSLTGENIAAAVQLAPDLIAVRAAACDAGRGGTVSVHRVRELKQAIASATRKLAAV